MASVHKDIGVSDVGNSTQNAVSPVEAMYGEGIFSDPNALTEVMMGDDAGGEMTAMAAGNGEEMWSDAGGTMRATVMGLLAEAGAALGKMQDKEEVVVEEDEARKSFLARIDDAMSLVESPPTFEEYSDVELEKILGKDQTTGVGGKKPTKYKSRTPRAGGGYDYVYESPGQHRFGTFTVSHAPGKEATIDGKMYKEHVQVAKDKWDEVEGHESLRRNAIKEGLQHETAGRREKALDKWDEADEHGRRKGAAIGRANYHEAASRVLANHPRHLGIDSSKGTARNKQGTD
jgi:hypothetical protein